MCPPAIGAAVAPATAGTAAAATVGLQVMSLAVAAAGTAAGIAQAQQGMNMQVSMARQQQDLAFRQAQQQAQVQNLGVMQRHIGEVKTQQAQFLAAQNQFFYNDQAANSKYVADQIKLKEARDKASFRAQTIYAKSIGSKGSVLASGLTGQSIGLLALDAERKGGFARSQQDATIRSAEDYAVRSMETARLESESQNNIAASRVGLPVQAPTFAPEPIGIGKDLEISGVPAYNWT